MPPSLFGLAKSPVQIGLNQFLKNSGRLSSAGLEILASGSHFLAKLFCTKLEI